MIPEKSALRTRIAERIRAWSSRHKARLDIAILEHLRQLCLCHPDCSGTILAYAPLPDEPDCMPWLLEQQAMGVRILFPRTAADGSLTCHEPGSGFSGLRPGRYGVREPAPDARSYSRAAVRMILVPGRAFTVSGDRLGRGGGHYDRFLRGFEGVRVALAYEEQMVPELPVTESDEKVNILVTPDRILPCD